MPYFGKPVDRVIKQGQNTVGSDAIIDDSVLPAKLDSTASYTVGALTVDTSTLVVDATNNRVGIGTASPGKQLHVHNGSGNSTGYVTNTASGTSADLFVGYWDGSSTYQGLSLSRTYGSADISYNVTQSGGQHLFKINGSEKMRIDSSGNVGIGTDSPNWALNISKSSGATRIELNRANTNGSGTVGAISFTALDEHAVAAIDAIGDGDDEGAHLRFLTTSAASDNNYFTGTTERMRIESNGAVLIGKTATDINTSGIELGGSGYIYASRTDNMPLVLNRKNSNGILMQLRKDNTIVGNIGVDSTDNIYFCGTTGSTKGIYLNNSGLLPQESGGTVTDDVADIGTSSYRWKALWLSRYVDLQGNRITGFSATIADDAYAEISVYGDSVVSGGHLFVRGNTIGSAYPNVSCFAHIFADFGASPSAQIVNQWSSAITISTAGEPTGTSGTDTKVNFFFGGTNGNFYIENRIGGSTTFYISLI